MLHATMSSMKINVLKGCFVKVMLLKNCLFLSAACLAFSVAAHAEVAVVLNSGEGTVSVIDKASMTETKRINVGKEPHHLMATPDDKFLIEKIFDR